MTAIRLPDQRCGYFLLKWFDDWWHGDHYWRNRDEEPFSKDEDHEQRVSRAIFVLVAVALISGIYTWWEVRYLLWGKIAPATVVRVEERRETHSGRGSRRRGITGLADGGSSYTTTVYDITVRRRDTPDESLETFRRSSNPHLPVGRAIKVEFVPGSPSSLRLAHDRDWARLTIFLGSMVLVVAGIFWIARQANTPYRKQSRLRPSHQIGREREGEVW